MELKKKSKVTSMFSKEDAQKMAEEYNDLSVKIKELEARKKKLSDILKNCAEAIGVVDDKGSSYIDCDTYVVGRVAKKSVKIDQEKGVNLLREKGLKKCIDRKVVYTVNEAEVEQAVAREYLTEEEVRWFTSVSTSYSVSVKKKEDIPEVEVGAVARKKK